MIERYEVKEVSALWSDTARYQKFLQVELALLETLEGMNRVPKGTTAAYQNVEIRPARVTEIEATTRHDVIAFCTSITEQVKPEAARYFHFGVTSSDILDTALSLQIRDSLTVVIRELKSLVQAIDSRIPETSDLLCLGRSHGMAAEPLVFAQKLLTARMEFARRLKDYEQLIQTEITGQISGAVGNYTVLSPEIEKKTLARLNLPVEPVSTQVIPRDHLAKVISAGALTATAIERLAVEIRHLHHSDIAELHEGFKAGQKGSSTMPHKKNPISSENLTGMARILRSHEEVALQNVVLWHERDISHSSTERMYLPDHFGLLVYSLKRMADTMNHLEFHRESIESKVKKHFMVFSSLILHQLIEQNPVPREELYPIVQAASFQATDLESMIAHIQGALKSKGLKWTPPEGGLNWDGMKAFYLKRFQEIKVRCA